MIDNTSLATKLALRRQLLRQYHAGQPLRVLDCCAGTGAIWTRLRHEFPVSSYLGIDQKGGAGLLKTDSRRVLAGHAWDADVVDIDTYGAPWPHWLSVISDPRPTALTVFLTYGRWPGHATTLSNAARELAGFGDLVVPPSITGNLLRWLDLQFLAAARTFGWTLTAWSARPPLGDLAIYYGVRLAR